MSNKLALVIGLGEIGRPLFETIKQKYEPVCGIDVKPEEISSPVGLMHVCYPFDLPGGFVEVTCAYAKKYNPTIIVINSTVSPGTTRSIEKLAGFPAVYSPVRGKHTKMASELVSYCKFVAGTNSKATLEVRDFFRAVGMPSDCLSQPETLELAKLFETTYFGVLIAWAQEMDRMARQVGADYSEITKFFEEIDYLPRHVFQPGFIGGHCVMPNIGILKRQFDSKLLDGVVDSNAKKAAEIESQNVNPQKRLAPIKMGDRKQA